MIALSFKRLLQGQCAASTIVVSLGRPIILLMSMS
jgi:hypothetical protein